MLTLSDVERAVAARDPELGELVVRYLAQADPRPGKSELPALDDAEQADIRVPAGAYTFDTLKYAVSERGLAGKNPTEKKLVRRDAFAAAEASPFAPPRLRLGRLLVAIYEAGDPAGRAALVHVLACGKLRWGARQAAKVIYKRAEERHDPLLFGVLAYRFDAMSTTPYASQEIANGTLVYLRRRAWRYLRMLGRASPEAYATFAVEVLRHYPADYGPYAPSWIAAHIWRHGQMRQVRSAATFRPVLDDEAFAQRAYPAAWKLSPAPLLRLLDAANHDLVCAWAIRSLRADHALALRGVDPAWLARLGRRPHAAIHAFVVTLLRESPELHQSKLRELGLHDVVLGFLRSPSQEARTYALEYAAAHGADLPIGDLVELVESGAPEVAKFAAARLEQMPPQQLGLAALLRLLGHAAAPWVPAKLAQGFSPGVGGGGEGFPRIDAPAFVAVAARGVDPCNALIKLYNDARVAIPASHWRAVIEDARFTSEHRLSSIRQRAFEELGKRPARAIGIAWIQQSLEDRTRTDAVARWLDAGLLSGDELDVEWLKMLVGKPRLRPIALRLLYDRRRVAPARVGLAWLLELARSSDGELAQFAQRMLLESFLPEDFAAGDRGAGVQRLWELATAKKSPEPVRAFAATYLKAHHPVLGTRLAEARSLGITPRLTSDAYPMSIVRPLLGDDRADIRRLAVAIAAEEIVAWGDSGLVYELAGSAHKEPRALGGELLLGIIVDGAARRMPAAWLDGRRLFQLAESQHNAAREVALTLIRRLYDQVGGAEKLAWLMDSPERDVRLFAVRLFWERHRPKPLPDGYAPRKQVGAPIASRDSLPASSAAEGRRGSIGSERFGDLAALRQFMRIVLFALPPGRIAERDALVEGAPQPERALPASVAKRRVIEAMRDVALEDIELARAIVPVLGEFVESTAKGEWHASVQAVTALKARHRAALEAAA